jgi:hypothetical protein
MGTPDEAARIGAIGRRRVDVGDWATGRKLSIDNLKVVLIALIIAIHGVLGYVGFDQFWSYADVQEVVLSPVTEIVLLAAIVPFGLFMIALLFLVAGLLSRPSLERKGPGRFAADRLLRLGGPFALFTFALWPLLMYALYHPLGAAPGSYWAEFLDENGHLDTGPMWFVGVLLIYSLGYAAWVALRRRTGGDVDRLRRRAGSERAISVHTLLMLAAVVTAASFLVRLVFPYASEGITDLNLWEWPACFALFALGIAASRQGWLSTVPRTLRRQCFWITLAAAAMTAAFAVMGARLGLLSQFFGGWTWTALLFAALESTLIVFGSVWLLGASHAHLERRLPLGPVLSRSSYAAFLVQGVVLISLAVALRPVPVIAEVKALVVALGAVAGSFALGWLLISRVPGVARIL